MKFAIVDANAKIFAKAIQSLSKVGADLFLEADENGISIRTVNSTNSAFVLFKFSPDFFTDYNLETDESYAKCKLSIKACLNVFKCMKKVEVCIISINKSTLKLVIELECRLDTVKRHFISILELESLKAVYITDSAANKLSASHKLFSEISNNFQLNEEEITVEVNKKEMKVKNYIEGTQVDKKFMRSQLTLKPEEFNQYLITEDTSITFCLREFRALLGFVEAVNLDLSLNFETAGRPVVFILKNCHLFEANLVMSTLAPDDITMCENNSNQSTSIGANITLDNSTEPNPIIEDTSAILTRKRKTIIQSISSNEIESNTDPRSIERIRANTSKEQNTSLSLSSRVYDTTTSNLKNTANKTNELKTPSGDIYVTFKDTQDIDDECIITSPTKKRKRQLRGIFRRCFEATIEPQSLDSDEILAKNSDTED